MRYLYFSSQHCAPCQALKPRILKHKEIRVVDVDKDSVLTNRYGIMSIPTVIVLNGSDDTVEQQISGSRIGKWLSETFEK